MLSKLLKYEYKATARIFSGIYLAILVAAIVMGVSIRFSESGGVLAQWNEVLSSISIFGTNWATQMAVIGSFAYVCLVIAMFVVLFVSICQRFYRNLLGNEGYLMHTLPVTPALLILSKLLVALFWSLLSLVALFVSLSVLVFILTMGFSFDYSILRQYLSYFEWSFDFVAVMPMLFGSFLGTMLRIYLAMLVGHQFKKASFVLSVVAYFVINNIQSVFVVAVSWVVYHTPLVYLANSMPLAGSYFMAFLLQLAIATVYFFCAEYLMRKHLNLE